MKTGSSRTALSIVASLLLVAGLAHDVEAARGGRGGGGGGGARAGGGASFSRSGPGASGSFSAARRPAGASGTTAGARQVGATQRSGQRAASTQTASRQAGATERSGQRAETRQTRTQAGSSARTSGQGERTERTEARQQGQTERTEVRQQGQTERTEARSTAAASIADDWDSHHYDYDDDEWGYAFAGAAVGATLGYMAGAATAAPTYVSPTYVTVLPCSPNVVVAGGTNYYGCGGTWYNRSYAGGSVTYVIVNPPPGY